MDRRAAGEGGLAARAHLVVKLDESPPDGRRHRFELGMCVQLVQDALGRALVRLFLAVEGLVLVSALSARQVLTALDNVKLNRRLLFKVERGNEALRSREELEGVRAELFVKVDELRQLGQKVLVNEVGGKPLLVSSTETGDERPGSSSDRCMASVHQHSTYGKPGDRLH